MIYRMKKDFEGKSFPAINEQAGLRFFQAFKVDTFRRLKENHYYPLNSISVAVYLIPDYMMEENT